MAATSFRNLSVGSGTVSVTSGSRQLTFSAAQQFKQGETVIVDYAGTPQYFTIDVGSGTSWIAIQNATATASAKAYKRTTAGTSRARGTDGVVIPDAMHYVYRAIVDDAGTGDAYHYVDTITPEKGLHPYTRDQYTGMSFASSTKVQELIPDDHTRLRILEGALRWSNGTLGDTATPDKRLRDMESRLNAIEVKLNGGATPSTQTVTPPTKQQLLDNSDQ